MSDCGHLFTLKLIRKIKFLLIIPGSLCNPIFLDREMLKYSKLLQLIEILQGNLLLWMCLTYYRFKKKEKEFLTGGILSCLTHSFKQSQ